MGKGTGSEARKGRSMASAARMGSQKDYLEGLDNLRRIITNLECDVDKLKREFFCCEKNEEDEYEAYLKKCNERLQHCKDKLRQKKKTVDVVNGEVKLVSLLNKIRELDSESVDPDVISFLTDFWEHSKECLDGIVALKHKYHKSVLQRLKSSCVSYNNGDARLELSRTYTMDVTNYQTEITDFVQSFDEVSKSFTNGLNSAAFTDTSFSDRILATCDQKAFPLLRLMPDLTEKLMAVCKLSRQWVDKDETYVHDINNYIREKRKQTRKKEEALRIKRAKQDELSKSEGEAFQLFKSHKRKLQKIEAELKTLDDQVERVSATKCYKMDDIKQKEGMIGFLDISITQTKKNYTLQLKRSRLMRQVRELEESLKEIEVELTEIEETSKKKATEKDTLSRRVDESDSSYQALKSDLEKFSKIMDQLQVDVAELTDSLSTLETIQTCKTSPEKVDDFYERPTTVKLAPSLKQKILQRKKMNIRAAGRGGMRPAARR